MRLCACGCGEPAPIATYTSRHWGWVKGEPKTYKRGHSGRILLKHVWNDNLWEERDCGNTTPCHVWIGTRNSLGYGILGSSLAYGISWERTNGPVPTGLELDHLCRNPSCVRPDHLEAVTHRENIRRGKGTKINQQIADEMRSLYSSGAHTQKAIAERFGVEKRTVWEVVNNRRWVH